MGVTIYSQAGCGKCKNTERQFDKKGIAYTEIYLTDHPQEEELREQLRVEGFDAMPVVKTDLIGNWCDMRPDKIMELDAANKAAIAELAVAV